MKQRTPSGEDDRRRESAVNAILETNDVAQHVSRVADEIGVSRRTVFRWLAVYRQTPQSSALLHRTMGPPVGGRRIAAHLERLINQRRILWVGVVLPLK
jgi:putative transposase